ncbi:DUF4145 domain-containing protein [Stenotrophomonas maltophilia]|uniref:DUF4145 domain-containing protein n=1 Tax=Stenotrophomonas maltophilia TaxID=40324 RepID=UPI002893B3A9|nr:DUF4145 domain-containing protein [Stenotrophomonas maltophilia]MDT3447874.1 DUF4145 domain-containing protein [Stenotrophomonas maltophilia]
MDDEDDWTYDIVEWLTPAFFHPPLRLIDLPEKCPDSVKEHLNESFAVVYSNPGAALNCARIAVEALLTELGVPRFTVKNKKKHGIKLHQRIERLDPKYSDVVDMLLAVKWLGNAGSHSGDKPTTAEVMVAYEILEHVLSEIYVGSLKKIKKYVASVNKAKGLVKKSASTSSRKKSSKSAAKKAAVKEMAPEQIPAEDQGEAVQVAVAASGPGAIIGP